MPAGGRRPGAGAPRGNTNALKFGRRSAHLKAILGAISQVPEARDYFAMVRLKQIENERIAAAELRTALLEVLKDSPAANNALLTYLGRTRPGSIDPSTNAQGGQASEDNQTKNKPPFTHPTSFKSRQKNTIANQIRRVN